MLRSLVQRERARRTRKWLERRNANYRTELKSVGRPVRIGETVEMSALDQISIGDNVVIHGPSYLWAAGGLEIGDNVAIAQGCNILTTTHVIDGDALPWSEETEAIPVVIQDNVWIGLNVTILPGVTIHEGAVVGAAAVVTHDIPKGAIAVGNPAKVIRQRDLERYEHLKAQERFRIIPTAISRETLVTG